MNSTLFKTGAVLLGLFIMSFSFTGCGDDDPMDLDQNVSVKFKTTFDGSSFAANEALQIENDRFEITLLKFYISNLVFTKTDNTEVIFPDPFLVDLSSSLGLIDQLNLFLEPGQYKSLRFAIGLDEATNDTNAETLETSDPLSSSQNMWWGWAKAYKFIVMEGRYDSQPLGTETWDQAFAYHMGNDEIYTEINVTFDDNVKSNELSTIDLNIDVKKIFFSNDNPIDINEQPTSHADISPFVIQLSDNFVGAFD